MLGQFGALVPGQGLAQVLRQGLDRGQQAVTGAIAPWPWGRWTSIVNRVCRSTRVAIAERQFDPRSKKEMIEKQARFWVVMAAGSTLQAACDAVGVNRLTGRRWRQATGGQVPRRKPAPSGRYLSLDERLRIADLRLAGDGVRAIATAIGRSPSTVSRELRRNGPAPGKRKQGQYAPHTAC